MTTIFRNTVFAIALCSIISCGGRQEVNKEASEKNLDTAAVEKKYPSALNELTKAHKLSAFNSKEVVAFDLELYFRGNLRLAGSIHATTNFSKVLIKKKDGSNIFFDGSEVYVSPDTVSTKGARFDALTWSYFALAPFKFNDDGTKWSSNGELPLDSAEKKQPTLKLTFGDNIGDAPDDWYIIYKYPETNLLKAMAYIVTFGNTSQEEAAENPHAIVYSNYEKVEGIQIATSWTFYNWNEQSGLGEQLGKATIDNIRFTEETPDMFAVSNKKLVPLEN